MDNRNYDLRVDISYEVPGFRLSDGKTPPTRFKALLLYLIMGAGLLVSSLVASGVQLIFPGASFWILQVIVSLIYYGGAFFLPLMLFLKKGGRPAVYAMRPSLVSFRTAIISVALAVVGVYFANNLTALWSLPFDAAGFNIYTNSVPTPQSIPDLILALLSVGVFPGLFEEAAFRGFMMPAFEEKGTKRAIVFITLLFALLHGSVVGFPAQFILGAVMAVLLVLTDSIYPGIIFHTVYNSGTMILAYMQSQMGVEAALPGELFASIGIEGLVLVMAQLPMQAAAIFFMFRGLYCRAKNSGFMPIEKQKMRLRGGEIALLCGGLSFAVLYYIIDILAMTGVLV